MCVKNYFTRYNGNSRTTGGMPWGYIGITRSQVEVATQKPAGSWRVRDIYGFRGSATVTLNLEGSCTKIPAWHIGFPMIIFGDKKNSQVCSRLCCCMHLKFGTCIAEKGMLLWEKYQEIMCFGASLLVTNREIIFSSKIFNKKLRSDIQRLIVQQTGRIDLKSWGR